MRRVTISSTASGILLPSSRENLTLHGEAMKCIVTSLACSSKGASKTLSQLPQSLTNKQEGACWLHAIALESTDERETTGLLQNDSKTSHFSEPSK